MSTLYLASSAVCSIATLGNWIGKETSCQDGTSSIFAWCADAYFMMRFSNFCILNGHIPAPNTFFSGLIVSSNLSQFDAFGKCNPGICSIPLYLVIVVVALFVLHGRACWHPLWRCLNNMQTYIMRRNCLARKVPYACSLSGWVLRKFPRIESTQYIGHLNTFDEMRYRHPKLAAHHLLRTAVSVRVDNICVGNETTQLH